MSQPEGTVLYGAESPNQVLDLYRPDRDRSLVPVVIAIHGDVHLTDPCRLTPQKGGISDHDI